MLKLFLKRSKGSITVLVTLLMVPTIFFTGFLVDLARIKLYGNQALMTADNYGETVLAEYDALLKDLYGLFAITQDEQGKAAIETLQTYMKTSWNPSLQPTTRDHVAGLISPLSGEFYGFMPYRSAEVTLSYKPIESSRLDQDAIMSSQIGDFMRFRIVQLLSGSEEKLMQALEEVQNTEGNAEVIKKKNEVDDAAGAVLEKMKEFYDTLSRLQHYPDYIRQINRAREDTIKTFADVVRTGHYITFQEYEVNKREIEKARNKKEEDRTQEDEKYIRMGEAYDADPEARKNRLQKRFDYAIDIYEKSRKDATIDFDSFQALSDILTIQAGEVKNRMETLFEKRKQLEQSMMEHAVSDDLQSGITEELTQIDRLLNGSYAGENYVAIANCVAGNTERNKDYELAMMNTVYQFEVVRDDYLNPDKGFVSSYKPELNVREYDHFEMHLPFDELYQSLKHTFETGSQGEENAKAKKEEAENRKKEAEAEMAEEESSEARDIPDGPDFQGIGGSGSSGGFTITDLAGMAADYFSANSFSNAGNKLLLKFYTVAYDFGMFSSRTTNVKDSSVTGQTTTGKAISLTGVEMGKSVNYLYQAELEYLFGGNKSSVENLNAARNHILAFRSVVNFTSTYSIKKIDDAIKTVSKACSAINPVLGIAAAAALRAGITAVETAMDWKELRQGNSIVLIKKEVKDLTSAEAIASLLGMELSDSGEKSSLELDYDQYLMVMIVFLTTSNQVVRRTGDLITLNVNTVSQGIGESGQLQSLDFRMEDAYTAVDATCAVHLDFVVMPEGFAQKMLDDSTYGEVSAFEKSSYKFTVTRGY